MDEAGFCAFYDGTARMLRAYLRTIAPDPVLVDDLLQESYFRLLKASLPASMEFQNRKNYLYRIAINLVHDHRRARKFDPLPDDSENELSAPVSKNLAEDAHDVNVAFAQLKPRQRDLLWLAYVECFSHKEMGKILRVGSASVRPMLARARKKFAELLERRAPKAAPIATGGNSEKPLTEKVTGFPLPANEDRPPSDQLRGAGWGDRGPGSRERKQGRGLLRQTMSRHINKKRRASMKEVRNENA